MLFSSNTLLFSANALKSWSPLLVHDVFHNIVLSAAVSIFFVAVSTILSIENASAALFVGSYIEASISHAHATICRVQSSLRNFVHVSGKVGNNASLSQSIRLELGILFKVILCCD